MLSHLLFFKVIFKNVTFSIALYMLVYRLQRNIDFIYLTCIEDSSFYCIEHSVKFSFYTLVYNYI